LEISYCPAVVRKVDENLVTVEPGNFKELLNAMREGSEEAAWHLTEQYSPHIMRAVRASLPGAIRSKVDSVDLLQSVWASMLLEPNRLTDLESPKQFIAYLVKATKNKVIDLHRHFSTQKKAVQREVRIAALDRDSFNLLSPRDKARDQVVDRDPSPSQTIAVRDAWQRVVDNSSPRDQLIIAMRIEGMDYQSIAKSLSIDKKTVQRAVGRMVREFQQ